MSHPPGTMTAQPAALHGLGPSPPMSVFEPTESRVVAFCLPVAGSRALGTTRGVVLNIGVAGSQGSTAVCPAPDSEALRHDAEVGYRDTSHRTVIGGGFAMRIPCLVALVSALAATVVVPSASGQSAKW